jgi:hypothetical protein
MFLNGKADSRPAEHVARFPPPRPKPLGAKFRPRDLS